MARFLTVEKVSPRITLTPEGFVVCEAVPIARTGDMEYTASETGLEPDASGRVRISRAADVVFADETLRSFEGKPVTIQHPDSYSAPDGMVTPQNWKQLAVGSVQNVRKGEGRDADKIMADLLLTDQAAIDVVRSRRMREVSCGYDTDYEQTGPGAGRQTRIVGNHVAIVDSGRAGPECAILDSKEDKEMSKLRGAFARLRKAFDAVEAEETAPKKAVADMTPEEMIAYIGEIEGKLEELEAKSVAEADKKAGDADEVEAEDKGKDEGEAVEAESKAAVGDADWCKGVDEKLSMLADALAKMIPDSASKATDSRPVAHDQATIARAEILAPGIAKDSRSLMADALAAAYKTEAGKAVIHTLTGGKAPTFDSATVERLFVPAAELLAAKRKMPIGGTPAADGPRFTGARPPTPAEMNAMFSQRK